MGGTCSQADATYFVMQFYNLALREGMMLDVGIDNAMIKYSGVNSNAVLQRDASELLAGQAPAYIHKVGTALGSFTPLPHAVGLGALIISMILEIALAPTKKPDSVADMLRRVFGEEKASDVRDTMHEYMKRYQMHLRSDQMLVADTLRLEQQLSSHLTRLRNSMLVDGQMS